MKAFHLSAMRCLMLVGAATVILSTLEARAVTVGPGIGTFNEQTDGVGGRINVDLSNPVNLGPGIYTATLFNYDAGKVGDVTPFLATDNGNGTYTAIAVGADQAIAGVATDQSVPFGGSSIFTLAASTLVYAGIASDTSNPIFFDNGVGLTDHEGNGAASYVVTVGAVVPPDNSFSDPDLGRIYAFSITVVPEPSSAVLALLGFFAMGFYRRRT